jgi:hypothetical protein
VGAALRALARCAATTAMLLARRRIHLARERVGTRIRFADGSSARVYRETVLDRPPAREPCALVVTFRLRAVRGFGHAVFRAENLLNTPLIVGFPGYLSKLWLAHDEHGCYRGLYEWDGPAQAEAYARALRWVLALVCVRGSIHHAVLPGVHRDELLDDPARNVVRGQAAPGCSTHPRHRNGSAAGAPRSSRRAALHWWARSISPSSKGPWVPVTREALRPRAAALRHAARHGVLPTVSALAATADVSRGTAATVLKPLRGHLLSPT